MVAARSEVSRIRSRDRAVEISRVSTAFSRAMRARALWVLLGILAFSVPSRADRLFRPHGLVRGATDPASTRQLMTSPSEWVSSLVPSGTPSMTGPGGRAPLGFPGFFRGLVVTRDLILPGAPFLALRLIPTRRALGGDTQVPIVLRPKVMATGWYGLDLMARF
jgi:hypothetical protein